MSQTHTTTLHKSETIAHGTMSFTLQRPDGFDYRAGQTVDLTITTATQESLTHTFSLVSAPDAPELVLATRIRDSQYKQTLKELTPGATVDIQGPYGSFFLHQDDSKPAVFLVGGIGITPFMSMIQDAINQALPHRLYLFYSNNSPRDSAFLDALTELSQQHPDTLTLIPTMTDTQQTGSDWSGHTGYIDWSMITNHIPQPENAIFYTAGPKGMVSAMRELLVEHDISEDNIRSEEFSGY